jgi:glucosamine-6-phosphate deaminase
MEVVIAAPDELARRAAGAIGKLLRSRPDAVLGLATGSSPLAVYDELVRRHVSGGSISELTGDQRTRRRPPTRPGVTGSS